MKRARVMILDDSALMRQLLSEVVSSDPELEVAATASNPLTALDAVERMRPDVLTLDVHMPQMDGLTFLEKLMKVHPMPVVMVSSATEKGCQVTLRALELGAVDFVAKPGMDLARGIQGLAEELQAKLKAAAMARIAGRKSSAEKPPPIPLAVRRPVAPALRNGPFKRIVAIGASTGGTEALREVLTALPPEAPPIVIVQHMPERFTESFAQRLDSLCPFSVREAVDHDVVEAGAVLIAPGNQHMRLQRVEDGYRVRLEESAPVNRHRPSVDVLFDSVADHAAEKAVGVILTGMGNDGAAGMLRMRQAGGITIAQDEESCVVFGMPKQAIQQGGVCRVLPLSRIGQAILLAARA